MRTLERLDAGHLEHAMVAYRDLLRSHETSIDALNVFPVPDGDTGTNMAMTMESVVAELGAIGRGRAGMAEVSRAIAHGSLMGARGNSGVILCQILKGFSECAGQLDELDPRALAECLTRGSVTAYGSTMRPVEGTMLTVARLAAARAEEAAAESVSLVELLDEARRAGSEALASTTSMLGVLEQAGVVDAGGAGFLLLFDALLFVVDGRALPEPTAGPYRPAAPLASGGASSGRAQPSAPRGGPGLPSHLYEVMYLLEAPEDKIEPFKRAWTAIGDSIAVVGGEGLWNCHIHTADIGAAVEAGLDVGRPRSIRVSELRDEMDEEGWVLETAGQLPGAGEELETAAVAIATGDGIGRIFRSLGVQRIVAGGRSMNPSTAQILDAVEAAPSPEVVVLPNNENIFPVAEEVPALAAKRVRVVRTANIAEALAALTAYRPSAPADDNVAAMEAAAGRVVSGEVTRAVRPAQCRVGPVVAGDWIGLSKGRIESVSRSVAGAVCGLLDAILRDEHELVTLIEGDGAAAEDTAEVKSWLAAKRPELAVEVHHGGQPLYPYMLSAE